MFQQNMLITTDSLHCFDQRKMFPFSSPISPFSVKVPIAFMTFPPFLTHQTVKSKSLTEFPHSNNAEHYRKMCFSSSLSRQTKQEIIFIWCKASSHWSIFQQWNRFQLLWGVSLKKSYLVVLPVLVHHIHTKSSIFIRHAHFFLPRDLRQSFQFYVHAI